MLVWIGLGIDALHVLSDLFGVVLIFTLSAFVPEQFDFTVDLFNVVSSQCISRFAICSLERPRVWLQRSARSYVDCHARFHMSP